MYIVTYRMSALFPSVLKISNNIADIRAVLLGLKIQYGERMAFVSYIDGEYGCRVMLYNSVVRDFATQQHDQNRVVVSLVFKGLTFYVQEYSDIVVEIQSHFFEGLSDSDEAGIDNTQFSWNHINHIVPNTKYSGTDGWNLNYIRGVHDDRYEDILRELALENVIYTTHYDGARRINVHNKAFDQDTFVYGKINGVNISGIGADIMPKFRVNTERTTAKNNNICLWIRNTNKWPQRNIPPEIYTRLFEYCVQKQKHLYVFQDLTAVPIPDHVTDADGNVCDTNIYIHEWQHIKEDNIPLMDKFMDICRTCYIFVGATSGIADMVSTYTNVNIILTSEPAPYMAANGIRAVAHTSDELVQHLEQLYG